MYQFGPYGPNHATAGTFAFKRELLKTTKYQEEAALAEEKAFLRHQNIMMTRAPPAVPQHPQLQQTQQYGVAGEF